ncbi:MAG TPA: hypothetical protein VFU94_01045 [Conexibacter sp.]|nr:hypothetical protein [Conexibacter sp.]
MGISTTSTDAGTATTPGDSADGSPRPRRGWLSRAKGASTRAAPPPELVEELEREVALLREENARLRVGRERIGERPVNARVRDTLALLRSQERADDVDEPWELLTECMLMRDSLADACRELERGARELRQRLETILPGSEGARAEALVSDDLRDAA